MTLRRFVLSVLVLSIVAVLWNGLLHLVLIRSIDAQVTHLFRADVSFALSMLLTIAIIALFVLGYSRFAKHGTAAEGAKYGFFFSLVAGVLVDFNQFVLYPIPFEVAATWFCGGVVEFTLYGVIVARLAGRGASSTDMSSRA